MEQQFNQSELEHLANVQNKRKAKFAQMGVTPTFTNEQTSSAASNSVLASASPTSRDRLSKIREIQQGALKTEMRHFNNADSPNDSFQEIPVKRPVSPEEEQRKSEEIKRLGLNKKSVSTQGSSQMSAMEAMFDSDSGSYSSSSDVVMGNKFEERKAKARFNEQQQYGEPNNPALINEDAMMGGIGSWENQFKSRVGQPQQNNIQQNHNQHPNPNTGVINEGYQQAPMGYQEAPIGPTQLNQLIESKASQIVEAKMKEMLSEFSHEFSANKKTELKQGQVLGEKVKARSGNYYKDVLKIDGKLYKLQEIKR
jgi:hypothetical protein